MSTARIRNTMYLKPSKDKIKGPRRPLDPKSKVVLELIHEKRGTPAAGQCHVPGCTDWTVGTGKWCYRHQRRAAFRGHPVVRLPVNGSNRDDLEALGKAAVAMMCKDRSESLAFYRVAQRIGKLTFERRTNMSIPEILREGPNLTTKWKARVLLHKVMERSDPLMVLYVAVGAAARMLIMNDLNIDNQTTHKWVNSAIGRAVASQAGLVEHDIYGQKYRWRPTFGTTRALGKYINALVAFELGERWFLRLGNLPAFAQSQGAVEI